MLFDSLSRLAPLSLAAVAALLAAGPLRAGGPSSYCAPKASTAGCLALMTTSDPSSDPVSGANDYSVLTQNSEGFRTGILFTTLAGSASIPFQGGTLCMLSPIQRSNPVFSFGSFLQCDGQFTLLINDGLGIGTSFHGFEAGAGNTSWVQTWYRSTGLGDGFETALSNALAIDWL